MNDMTTYKPTIVFDKDCRHIQLKNEHLNVILSKNSILTLPENPTRMEILCLNIEQTDNKE